MIFDENALGKTAIGLYPTSIAANATSTAVAIDTAGYESCVLAIAIKSAAGLGEATASTGVPIAITVSNNDSDYSAIDVNDVITTDGLYNATTKALTVTAADITATALLARVSVVTKYRYVKITVNNPAGGDSTAFIASITAELGRPRYSADFLAYNVVPTQA